MRTLILVKHAPPRIEPTAPAPTWPLTEEGRGMCRILADAATRWSPSFVVASREAKAAETGILVARALRVSFTTAEGLHEHDRRGVPFLVDRREFLARMRDAFARPSERVLGNETLDQARDRFTAAVAAAIERRPEGNPLVVSHGTVLALYVARATGVDPYALWTGLRYPCLLALSWPELVLQGTWNVEAPVARPPV